MKTEGLDKKYTLTEAEKKLVNDVLRFYDGGVRLGLKYGDGYGDVKFEMENSLYSDSTVHKKQIIDILLDFSRKNVVTLGNWTIKYK